jgi:hypothetical protein
MNTRGRIALLAVRMKRIESSFAKLLLGHAAPIRAISMISLTVVACLFAGCGRNAIWSTPDSHSVPLALALPNVTTNKFTLRSARYSVSLFHQKPCSVIQSYNTNLNEFPKQIGCDISIMIRRGTAQGPVLLDKHTTNAILMSFGSSSARYRLGYFESAVRGRLVMIVSNSPSAHDDTLCHARVDVVELLPK